MIFDEDGLLRALLLAIAAFCAAIVISGGVAIVWQSIVDWWARGGRR